MHEKAINCRIFLHKVPTIFGCCCLSVICVLLTRLWYQQYVLTLEYYCNLSSRIIIFAIKISINWWKCSCWCQRRIVNISTYCLLLYYYIYQFNDRIKMCNNDFKEHKYISLNSKEFCATNYLIHIEARARKVFHWLKLNWCLKIIF